jgi:flagellar basal-body rod protein FlgB
MDPTGIPLFQLAEKRLAWTDRRQQVLAQNIANLDTPHFQAKDLPPFAQALDAVSGPALARTDPGHLAGTQDTGGPALLTPRPTATAPDGNAVSLDQQLTQVADTATDQEVATSIYKKYLGMFAMALGYSH